MSEYQDNQKLISSLRGFATREELESSSEYAKHRGYIDKLLRTVVGAGNADGPSRTVIRVVHWNIEKGKYLDEVIHAFNTNPILKSADLISINEADVGMNRSGQRFVARELGEALKMNWAFAPCYLEFSKGYGDDLTMEGENTIALQGNAILSRYPIASSRVIDLPLCYDHFSHVEKRIGNRNGLLAEIATPMGKICFVTAHLEVRNAPSCRAKQIDAIVKEMPADLPGLIAGDFNSNTFARGGMLTTLQGFARLMFSNADRLRESIRQPQSLEPLFSHLRQAGFEENGFNDGAVSCFVPMTILEDSKRLPGFLASAVNRQMARYNGRLDFRLDWILGRGFRALKENEVIGEMGDESSPGPLTLAGLRRGDGSLISDHDPICVDVVLAR